ncbi:ABC transporter substrate-binding protein [Kocuria sp. M1R5S2]|uniref:ABC transporter substrate-binding protein n=1 Tax=Kocuria rhizosphaerae TaxID=3376285 RepID=UPI0037B4B1D6
MDTRNTYGSTARRRTAVAVAAVAATMAVAGCGGGGGGDGSGPIRIAALYPTSGSLALLGEESWRGANLAAQAINEAGGIDGRDVELVQADVPDVNAATSEARRMLDNEGLDLAIGTYSSSLALAASEVYARGGGTYAELGAISEEFTDRGYESVWRTNPAAGTFAETQIEFISEFVAPELGIGLDEVEVLLVHEDSSYGSSVARSAETLAEEAGIENISYEPYNAESTDLSSTVLGIQRTDPDVVIAVSYASDAILLARQMQENGVVVPAFVGTGGGHTLSGFGETLGEAADHVFNVDFTQYAVDPESTPGLEEFVAMYEEEYGQHPASGHSLANYMGANVVFDILAETGGDTSAEAFGEAAAAYTAERGSTATGWGVEFDDTGQNTLAAPYVMQWREGTLETVWPERVATMEPELATAN